MVNESLGGHLLVQGVRGHGLLGLERVKQGLLFKSLLRHQSDHCDTRADNRFQIHGKTRPRLVFTSGDGDMTPALRDHVIFISLF